MRLFNALNPTALGLIPILALITVSQAPGGEASRIKQQLDRLPARNEKPVAPADESTVRVNPPAFVWLPLKKRPCAYVLAVSRSEDFPADTTTVLDDVPISVHIPTAPMKPRRWYWRVGVRAADGPVVWSKVRSFTIAKDAETWPLPEINALVAKIPAKHPRLFFPGEKLAQARARCSGEMKGEYAKLLRAAERSIDEPLVPEPDFLRKKGAERAPEYVAIFRATRPPMDKMETVALAYLLSGQKRFGREAKRRILHFFSWDPNGSTSLFHNDEPAMWVMQRGTRAYDWTYDLFTPAERERIESVMKVRCEQFVRRLTRMPFESRPYSSHPARDLGFLGEAAMCFVHEWPEARQWLHYVIKIYWSVFPAWAGEDGGWHEGPGYWGAYMSFALHFAAALQEATGARITQKPFFRNTPYYKLFTNPPYARMSPFGDGQSRPPSRGTGHLMYHFSTLLGDPHVRWYPEVQKPGPGAGAMGFALADPDLKARPPVDLPQSRLFPGAGLVAMHTNIADPKNNVYFVMRSSPFGSVSHGHADQNAFVVEGYGEALAVATGYYPWYGSAHHSNWTRETKAKNSVTIDGGIGQTKRRYEANGRIARFLAGEQYDYALGDATPAYSGRLTSFHRHVVHVRPGTFVLLDELAAPKPVTFEWWLHALEEMAIDGKKREVLISRGGARLRAAFVVPEALAFTQTDKFDPPPENDRPNQWHLTASTRAKTQSATFMVVLSPYRGAPKQGGPDAAPALRRIAEGEVMGVASNDGDVEHIILVGTDGISTQGVETDARLVACRRTPGGAIGWLVVDATKLRVAGQTLFTSEAPTTATWSSDPDGGSLATDGPATTIRLKTAERPVLARRGSRTIEIGFDDGTTGFSLPEGRVTTRLFFRPPVYEPVLTVNWDGKKQELRGKRFGRTRAIWRQCYEGADGEFRLVLPPGLKLILDVEAVRADKVSIRHGQTLWWYGRVSKNPAELILQR